MQRAMLVTRVGGLTCAIPIEHVIETMRPLPIEPIGRAEDPVLASVEGLAMIRGAPVPVVDIRKLLGMPCGRAQRFVLVRGAERRTALLVDAVIAVSVIELGTLSHLPLLLDSVNRDSVSAIGSRDAALLIVLDTSRVIPDDTWRTIERAGEQKAER